MTTINQTSSNLSVDWSSFNVAPQETVNFVQPSTAAIAVNRIHDTNGSQILGHMNANGQVYLINPNGIVFGKDAQVNVGGLVASTLDVNDTNLSNEKKMFSGDGSGAIVNKGTLKATDTGYIALLGKHVRNEGTITARLGSVALGAGSAMTITFDGNHLVSMQVDESVLNSLAENGGLMRADGGQVLMTAGAKDSLLASVVNNTGVIEARTVENHNGTIMLLGSMTGGTAQIDGTLDASAPTGGDGGFIETSAAQVIVADNTKVTTAAPSGEYGSWLIDPQDYTVAASGGNISGAVLSENLNTTSITLQSSSGGMAGSGNVNVNDAITWSANTTLTLIASNDINVNANITATGNSAGLVFSPNSANGSELASGTGVFNLNNSSVTLSGTNPTLSIAGISYIVINSLGNAADATSLPPILTLQGITAANMAGHYALGSNIDALASGTWNAGAGFVPIGSVALPFTGTFEGLGHTISDLSIIRDSTSDVGLFGSTGTAAVIRNVGLIDSNVVGLSSAGGLVGSNTGTVTNSYATFSSDPSTSSVSGGSTMGGLLGSNTGTVTNSYARSSVSGTSSLGGLMGSNTGTVSNSYATGNITGTSSLGGLMGSNTGVVTDSYATGSVAGTTSVGGLMGSNTNTVRNTYSTGAVSGTTSVGGLMGSSTSPVFDSYWNRETSGQITSAAGTALTTAEMLQPASFPAWDFEAVWVAYTGLTNPLLRSFMTSLVVTANDAAKIYDTHAYSGGNGVNYSTIPTSNLLGTVTYSGSSQGAIDVGSYSIAPSGLYSNQQGYLISYGTGALVLSPAPLTVGGIGANNKIYDTTTAAILNGTAAVTGLGADNVFVTGTGVGVFASQNVGTHGVTVSGYTLGGTDAGNYLIAQPAGLTASISAASLTVGGVTANDKVYDATTAAILSGMAAVTALGDDNVFVTGTGVGVFASQNVGTHGVSVSGYTLGGTDAGNYLILQPSGLTASISAANLTVSGVTASDKVYDATTAAVLNGTAAVTGLGGDDVFVTGTGVGVFASANVGTHGITVSDYTLGGTSASNYVVMQPLGITASISAMPSAILPPADQLPIPAVPTQQGALPVGPTQQKPESLTTTVDLRRAPCSNKTSEKLLHGRPGCAAPHFLMDSNELLPALEIIGGGLRLRSPAL